MSQGEVGTDNDARNLDVDPSGPEGDRLRCSLCAGRHPQAPALVRQAALEETRGAPLPDNMRMRVCRCTSGFWTKTAPITPIPKGRGARALKSFANSAAARIKRVTASSYDMTREERESVRAFDREHETFVRRLVGGEQLDLVEHAEHLAAYIRNRALLRKAGSMRFTDDDDSKLVEGIVALLNEAGDGPMPTDVVMKNHVVEREALARDLYRSGLENHPVRVDAYRGNGLSKQELEAIRERERRERARAEAKKALDDIAGRVPILNPRIASKRNELEDQLADCIMAATRPKAGSKSLRELRVAYLETMGIVSNPKPDRRT